MSASAEYVEYIKELLGGFPDLQTKKYFGGVALRSAHLGKDIQFATILGDVLYFVVDDITRSKYKAKGLKPFSYDKQDKTVVVQKWYTAPEELFEDEVLMKEWAMEALEASMRSK
jgi:DNA transformation protein